MKGLSLVLLLFIQLVEIQSQQYSRLTWEKDEETVLLYRIEDNQALAELSLTKDSASLWKPHSFILQTETMQFGSLSPAGLFRFINLNSLIQNSELRKNTGLQVNRNSSLESSAGASFEYKNSGIYLYRTDELLQSGIWLLYESGLYSTWTIGLTVSDPGSWTEDDLDQEWFSDSFQKYPVIHPGIDIKLEGAQSRFHCQVAASLSKTTSPAYSFLPVYTFLGNYWENTIRFWMNSEQWRNALFELSPWRVYLENAFTYNKFLWTRPELEIRAAQSMEETHSDERPLSFASTLLLPLDFYPHYGKINYSYVLNSGIDSREQEAGLLYRYQQNRGYVSTAFNLDWNARSIEKWKGEIQFLRRHPNNLSTRVNLGLQSEAGSLMATAFLKESIYWKNFQIHCRIGTEMLYDVDLTQTTLIERNFLMKIILEWNHGDNS